jgi:hypothetical protein
MLVGVIARPCTSIVPQARLYCEVVSQSASIDLGFSVSTAVHRAMQMEVHLMSVRGRRP